LVNDTVPIKEAIANIKYAPIMLWLSFKESFFNFKSWGILWYIIAFSCFYGGMNRYLLIPIAYYLLITAIYVFYSPHFGEPKVMVGTNFERFRIHTLPLLVYYCWQSIKC
jgi:hypothetical protein